jgi:hypothetical protein
MRCTNQHTNLLWHDCKPLTPLTSMLFQRQRGTTLPIHLLITKQLPGASAAQASTRMRPCTYQGELRPHDEWPAAAGLPLQPLQCCSQVGSSRRGILCRRGEHHAPKCATKLGTKLQAGPAATAAAVSWRKAQQSKKGGGSCCKARYSHFKGLARCGRGA